MIGFAFASLLALTQLPPSAAASALPLARCLRANRLDRWYVEHERAVLVRSGRHYFRVAMRNDCPTLGEGGLLGLRGAQTTRDFICGNVGEVVATRRGDCTVGAVTLLTRDEFLQHAEASKSRRSTRRNIPARDR